MVRGISHLTCPDFSDSLIGPRFINRLKLWCLQTSCRCLVWHFIFYLVLFEYDCLNWLLQVNVKPTWFSVVKDVMKADVGQASETLHSVQLVHFRFSLPAKWQHLPNSGFLFLNKGLVKAKIILWHCTNAKAHIMQLFSQAVFNLCDL